MIAHEFKPGGIAPDGSIWSAEPTARHTTGVVLIAVEDVEDAQSFGWYVDGGFTTDGKLVTVRRHTPLPQFGIAG